MSVLKSVDKVDTILKPLNVLLTLLGMSPPSSKHNNIKYIILRALISTCFITINVICSFLYVETYNKTVSLDFAKAGTIKFLSIFRDLGGTTAMIVTVVFSYINSKQMLEQVSKIYDVDLELHNLGLQRSLEEATVQVKNRLIVLMIISNFCFTICGEIESSIVRDTDILLYLSVGLYPRLVTGMMNISLYTTAMLVQSRFRMINSIFEEKIRESTKLGRYPIRNDFSDNTKHLVNLHKILVKVSKEINSVFSLQTLIVIAINFVLLIGDLHTSMYIIFFNLFSKHYDLVFDMIKNCITYTFDLVYMAKTAGDLCREANQTKVLLLGIRIDIDKEEDRDAVIASTLKLMQNKLEITACKLFNIDNALLFSICGAASSYLFIMLQLDIGNNQQNETTTEYFTTLSTSSFMFNNSA